MKVLALTSALSLAILVVAGCSKKESEPASVPETAATAQMDAPAEAAAADAAAPAAATVAAASDVGASAYAMFCVTCHGATGKGDGPASAALTPKPADFSTGAFRFDTNGNATKGDIDDIKAIIRDGAAKYGGSPLMAPWPMLSAAQLQAVAEHVKSMHGG